MRKLQRNLLPGVKDRPLYRDCYGVSDDQYARRDWSDRPQKYVQSAGILNLGYRNCIFLLEAFMALLLAESVAKQWGRVCDISIGTIVIISELMNCIKRRTAIRKAH